MEALQQAREQKLVRYLGITGHHRPDALMELIRRYPFDTVLLALNAADKHHFSFMEHLLPLAVEKQMGIIGMKIPARGRILSTWTPPPIEKQIHSWEGSGAIAKTPGTINMREAMYYALSLPVSAVTVGCDSVAQLEENVRLASEFTPLNEQQMAALAEKTQPISEQALFFRFLKRA
jgi:predicted aldo/keto reductase-like oxidoreductase